MQGNVMGDLGLIGTLIIGLLAGWIAARLLNRKQGLGQHLLVGLAGAALGRLLAEALGLNSGGWIGSLGMATIGALLTLSLVSLLRRS